MPQCVGGRCLIIMCCVMYTAHYGVYVVYVKLVNILGIHWTRKTADSFLYPYPQKYPISKIDIYTRKIAASKFGCLFKKNSHCWTVSDSNLHMDYWTIPPCQIFILNRPRGVYAWGERKQLLPVWARGNFPPPGKIEQISESKG